MIDQKFEALLDQLLHSDRDWFNIQKNRIACLEHLVATGKMVREFVEGELWYRALETEERVVLGRDFEVARAIQQLKAEHKKKKKIAAVPAGVVVEVDFRWRTLERRLRRVADDNEKGLVMCDWLIAAKLSAREQEFIASIRGQILARPKTFELSEKQANWLRDIWRRKGGAGVAQK